MDTGTGAQETSLRKKTTKKGMIKSVLQVKKTRREKTCTNIGETTSLQKERRKKHDLHESEEDLLGQETSLRKNSKNT